MPGVVAVGVAVMVFVNALLLSTSHSFVICVCLELTEISLKSPLAFRSLKGGNVVACLPRCIFGQVSYPLGEPVIFAQLIGCEPLFGATIGVLVILQENLDPDHPRLIIFDHSLPQIALMMRPQDHDLAHGPWLWRGKPGQHFGLESLKSC